MQEIFVNSFSATFLAVIKIFLIIVAGGVLVRRKYVSDEMLGALASSVVRIFLPCLIFSSIVKNFDVSELRIWPVLPLSAVLMVAGGIFFGAILFWKELPSKKNMLSMTSMQNAGYFILPLGAVVFPDEVERFNLYCFLYILGVSPLLWSVGKWLMSGSVGCKFSIKGLLTPPLAANIFAVIMVFTGLRKFLPSTVIESAGLLGRAAVPVATFILGGMLGGITIRRFAYGLDAFRVVFVKLILLPAVTMMVLRFSGLNDGYPLLCSFLVLEAAVAPATANLMQVKHYGGDEEKVSSITLLCYVLSIVTVPLSLAIWNILV